MHQISRREPLPGQREQFADIRLDDIAVIISEDDLDGRRIFHEHLTAVAAG